MSRVLVIGDTHCPGMKKGYVSFLQRIADRHSINRVVHIGDLVDWASISYHEKSTKVLNPEKEFKQAQKQVKGLSKAFPKVEWLIGNHDALTERQAQTVGIPSLALKSYQELWEVDWEVHTRFAKINVDNVVYSHGDSGKNGSDAAIGQAKDAFRSAVIGHFHTQGGVKWWANQEFRVFGMAVGCGIDFKRPEFSYGKKNTSKPILGCGIVLEGKQAIFEPWVF